MKYFSIYGRNTFQSTEDIFFNTLKTFFLSMEEILRDRSSKWLLLMIAPIHIFAFSADKYFSIYRRNTFSSCGRNTATKIILIMS